MASTENWDSLSELYGWMHFASVRQAQPGFTAIQAAAAASNQCSKNMYPRLIIYFKLGMHACYLFVRLMMIIFM